MDLNIMVYEESTFVNEKLVLARVRQAFKEGFKKLALSVVIGKDAIQRIPLPFKIIDDFDRDDTSVKIVGGCNANKRILHRLTVQVDEVIQLYNLSKQANLKYYDLIAIEPLNEKVLNYITHGHFGHQCDLVTFTFGDRKLPAQVLRTVNFSVLISKGIGIEINYGHCMSSASKRRETIAYGQLLVDKTKGGKMIILSSGNTVQHTAKSIADVIFIGLLFGLNEFHSKQALFANATKVVRHSEIRKNNVASVLEICDAPSHSDDLSLMNVTTDDNNDNDDTTSFANVSVNVVDVSAVVSTDDGDDKDNEDRKDDASVEPQQQLQEQEKTQQQQIQSSQKQKSNNKNKKRPLDTSQDANNANAKHYNKKPHHQPKQNQKQQRQQQNQRKRKQCSTTSTVHTLISKKKKRRHK